MCCRYVFDDYQEEKYQDELDKLINKLIATVKVGEICPSDSAAVIANSSQRNIKAFAMRWGYVQKNGLIFNARSETIDSKALFKDSFETRRCLVPANCYFEWQKDTRTKYAITKAHMFYMAGLYRLEPTGPRFTIITRPSSETLAFIHPRMPLILPSSALEPWLDLNEDPKPILNIAIENMDYKTA